MACRVCTQRCYITHTHKVAWGRSQRWYARRQRTEQYVVNLCSKSINRKQKQKTELKRKTKAWRDGINRTSTQTPLNLWTANSPSAEENQATCEQNIHLRVPTKHLTENISDLRAHYGAATRCDMGHLFWRAWRPNQELSSNSQYIICRGTPRALPLLCCCVTCFVRAWRFSYFDACSSHSNRATQACCLLLFLMML